VTFCHVLHTDSEGQCTFFTHGSLTFREAYLRTGRILNISVIPADRHSCVLAHGYWLRAASDQVLQADQTLELYDRPGLYYLERTPRFCRCARHPQLGCYAAEDEGWDGHPVELGEQVQRWESEVSYFLKDCLPHLPVLTACRVDIPVQALNLYFNGE